MNIRLVIITAALIFSGCTQKKIENQDTNNKANIFSNRPIATVPDLFVVTLESPPILKVAIKTKAGWSVPEEAKNKLLAEQAAFESQLKAEAPSAQIVYRYRMTLNGFALYASADVVDRIRSLTGVRQISPVRQMARAETLNQEIAAPLNTEQKTEVNSVNFIGAEEAYAKGLRGQGLRIGILDTGIDYTHAMLGGRGQKADYASVEPSQPSAFFPNSKVIGGIDLVGSDFNAASSVDRQHLPVPDGNPIDEAGHGTHVAGTVAGKGDGKNSYDGVAPDAKLYAIKVFGKEGSTMDAIVIAGFEFAADPNGDLNPDDQLDVINLSLGGGFGQPQILYTEAVRNLSQAGTIVVASAGNSGPIDYIVGAPGTSDDAISIAASVDGSPHNWQFAAVRFMSPNNPNWMAKATEGPISKPIDESGSVEGDLVDIGFADANLSEEVKSKLNGKVALISRGKVSFSDKLKRAFEAGAIGAVVYNNEPGKPIPMGGDGKIDMPAIMVSQALGMKLISEMQMGAVRIQFKTGQKIEEPELVDSITEFSSKGPRSEDNLIKPEIAAPGQRVISAAMGEGAGTIQMDGTSMAAPHMTGVMALLKQAHPDLSASQLKALAMNTAKILKTSTGDVAVSLQGAGRVQIDKAISAPIIVEPAALSLGGVYLEKDRTIEKTLTLTNITSQDIHLEISSSSSPGLSLKSNLSSVTVPANGKVELQVRADFTSIDDKSLTAELDGHLVFRQNGNEVAQVPALAIRTKSSFVRASGLNQQNLNLTNTSPIEGMALAFNLLGEDSRKNEPSPGQAWKNRSCDLQSVGYRIIKKNTRFGEKDFIQFGFKLYSPLTTWHFCEVDVLIDSDEDGIADQELAGVSAAGIEGFQIAPFATALLDAPKARSIRLQHEKNLANGKESVPDYRPAILGAASMAPFEHSTISVIEMPVELLAKTADGKLNIKVSSLYQGGESIEADDFLDEGLNQWKKIEASAEAQPYYGMPEFSIVTGSGDTATLSKGNASGKLLLYYPLNTIDQNADSQYQILN